MQVTHYKVFEQTGKTYTPARLKRLYDLCGERLEKFWAQIEKDADSVARQPRKDKINPESFD